MAHASERGHVLLLPTHYYVAGGALAVSLSFLVLAFLSPRPLEEMARKRLLLLALPSTGRTLASLLSFAVFACLVAAGFLGSRDPLSNPLPLAVWTLLWVGLTLAQGIFGNLWARINPWYGPWRVVMALTGRGEAGEPFRLPKAWGYWPAVMLLFAFAWFELVYLAPDDPARLAAACLAYWLFSFAGMLLFGYEDWARRVEFLSTFFSMIARLSPFEAKEEDACRQLALRLPGAKAVDSDPLPPSGVAFLLLALSSVSFDGFMRTFTWLGLIGINPLDFPGRSAVILPNSLGLAAMFAALVAVFLIAVALGDRMAARPAGLGQSAGLLVWSIVPISMAYHFSHYLTALLVNGQYALAALSDPLSKGWNLFGTAGFHVQAGVALGAQSAWMIWNAQVAAIIGGHMLAVVIAHVIAYRIHGSQRDAATSQIPLAALMVGYTVFGLWLLSSPTAG
ncbi:hypothetical protein [Mesorhizobium sp. J18]|uniref:hypothetical protein n=1 Tax=Mesorhizobium sp. J18 TaxID=935263 RepID=UPI001FEEC058|nr:hypothetical protein [Mesorhizobium sp. J18]